MPQTFDVDPYVSNKNAVMVKNLQLTFHQAKAVAVKSKAHWRQKRGESSFLPFPTKSMGN